MLKPFKFLTFCCVTLLFVLSVGLAKPSSFSFAATAAPTGAASGVSLVELVRKYDTSAHSIAEMGEIAVDGQGNLFVSDTKNNVVQKYDKDGTFVTQWGSPGSGDGQFNFHLASNDNYRVAYLAVDKQGNVYVADANNSRVQKFDSNGKFLSKLALADSTSKTKATVTSICLDAQGNLYVGYGSSLAMKLAPDGKVLSEYRKAASTGLFFSWPLPVAVDDQGNLYLYEFLNSRIWKLNPDGKELIQFNKTLETSKEVDGAFYLPAGGALDSKGRLYITDRSLRVQVFDQEGTFLGKWTGPDSSTWFVGGTNGIAIDGQDNIYVSDYQDIYQFRLHRELIFSIGKEDKSYGEFLNHGWIGKEEYVCRAAVDCKDDRFPGYLHVRGVYEDYGVVKLKIFFELKQSYKRMVLRLLRGGDETTVIRVDSRETYEVTSTMLGSAEGFRVGSYELDIGGLEKGEHSLEFIVKEDGKADGWYAWDALKLFGTAKP